MKWPKWLIAIFANSPEVVALRVKSHKSPHARLITRRDYLRHKAARARARAHAHAIKARHTLGATPERKRVVHWAMWAVRHSACLDYTESSNRDDWLLLKPGHLMLPSGKIDTDCSGLVTLCYKWARCADPNGLLYKYLGYTGTLLDHAAKAGKIVMVLQGYAGDPLVHGNGTGVHTRLLVGHGPNPMTVSHGGPGVQLEPLSVDPRVPQRVCRTLALAA